MGMVEERMSDHIPEEVNRSGHEVEQTTRASTAPLQRYCRIEAIKFPVGEGQQLIYSKLQGSAHLLSPDLILLLDHCRTFQTLDQHAREWLRIHVPDSKAQDSSLIAPILEQLS